MEERLEDIDVSSDFEDLTEVQLAYVFASEEPVVICKASLWEPFYFLSVPPAPREEGKGTKAIEFASMEDEIFLRMHYLAGERDEVDVFLRTCKDLFQDSWQPLSALRFVAVNVLRLSCADDLVSRRLMLQVGDAPVQGTWFPYWVQGETYASGFKEIKYRLAPQFFGVFSRALK